MASHIADLQLESSFCRRISWLSGEVLKKNDLRMIRIHLRVTEPFGDRWPRRISWRGKSEKNLFRVA